MRTLHVIDAFDLPEQVAVLRRAPDPELMEPVRNGRHPRKPVGGLWTSTYLGPDDVSAWWQWSAVMPDKQLDVADFSITPAEGLPVIMVDSLADGWALLEAYGSYIGPDQEPWAVRLDYERMAADGYAGLWLTARGFALHDGGLDGAAIDFRCYDCESTVWFVWPRGGSRHERRSTRSRHGETHGRDECDEASECSTGAGNEHRLTSVQATGLQEVGAHLLAAHQGSAVDVHRGRQRCRQGDPNRRAADDPQR